jgi:hypothetical protein
VQAVNAHDPYLAGILTEMPERSRKNSDLAVELDPRSPIQQSRNNAGYAFSKVSPTFLRYAIYAPMEVAGDRIGFAKLGQACFKTRL